MLAVETDGPLVIWDTVSGTEHNRIDHGEGHYAWGPSFSPDGTLLAVVDTSDDPGVPSRVMLYDAGTGTVRDLFEVGELNPHRTVFDPTGRRLAALSQTPAGVTIWDVESRDVVASLRLDGSPVALEWSPDGEVIAVSGNEGIARLFDVETGDEVLALVGHDSLVWSLAFSPDGVHLAGAGLGSDTLVWDVTAAGSRELATLATPYSNFWVQGVRYDADGDSILVTSGEGIGTTVARLDATTGEVLAAIPDQFAEWPVTPILASRAELVASLNADFTAALHDGETFAPITALPEGQFALAVSPDGTRVLLSSLDLTEAVVAEVGSWEVLMTLENTPVCFGHFSPDGSLLSAYNCVASGNNWVVDVEDASYLATFRSTGDDDLVEWIPAHFSPDGSLLVVRTLTGRVGLVDIAALRAGAGPEEAIVVDIDAHNGAVPDNTPFSPDGSLFATWGIIDRHLRVWKTENGELVADLGETEAIFPGFDFHPNGRHLIVAGADGTLRVYTLDPDELVQIAKSRVTRAFTEDECATYRIDPCPTLEDIQTGSA
jgi:WD40 repeat protein